MADKTINNINIEIFKVKKPEKEIYVKGENDESVHYIDSKDDNELNALKPYISKVKCYERKTKNDKYKTTYIENKPREIFACIKELYMHIQNENLQKALEAGEIKQNTLLSEEDVAKINQYLEEKKQIKYEPNLVCDLTEWLNVVNLPNGKEYSSICLAKMSKPDDDLPAGKSFVWYLQRDIELYDKDYVEKRELPDEINPLLRSVIIKNNAGEYNLMYGIKISQIYSFKNTDSIKNRLRNHYSEDPSEPVEVWTKLSEDDIKFLNEQLDLKLNPSDALCFQEV